MRFTRADLKGNFNYWIKTLYALVGIVSAGVENQTISSFRQRERFREKIFASAITVGLRGTQWLPGVAALPALQAHRHSDRGPAECGIQNMS